MTTHELFQKIREAPGLYLAPPSAQTLGAFLSGFEVGANGSNPEFLQFSHDFGNWLRKRHNLHTSQHWTKILQFYSASEGEEMGLFWKAYDEFTSRPRRKTRTNSDPEPSLTAS